MSKAIEFSYSMPMSLTLSRELINRTLKEVRDELLMHRINGGKRHLDMQMVCDTHECGTAACIGGWTGVLLIGANETDPSQRAIVADLFEKMIDVAGNRLSELFHNYDRTKDYNEPNVAATAIQRYLDGKKPWPKGQMPNVLRYKPIRKAAKTARSR